MCIQLYSGHKCEIEGIRGVRNSTQTLRSSTLKRIAIIVAETLQVMQHTTPCLITDSINTNGKKEVGATVQLWFSSVGTQPVRLFHVLANYTAQHRSLQFELPSQTLNLILSTQPSSTKCPNCRLLQMELTCCRNSQNWRKSDWVCRCLLNCLPLRILSEIVSRQ